MRGGVTILLVVWLLTGTAFVHPFLTYPASLRLLRRQPLRPASAQPADPPRFSLLFCAYNEIASVQDKLANLDAVRAAYPDVEMLAYDDASTDGTREALASRPDLLHLVEGAGRTGKAHGMKQLVSLARGEVLVFTDANVMLDTAALDALTRAYADPQVGGVCGRLRYTTSDEQTSTEAVGGLYWRLEEATKDWESRTGNVMGADGSIFSVRRALYPDFPDTVQDDFTVSMSVVFAGSRLVRRSDAVAYEALVSSSSEEFRRKVRIAARAYHTHRHLRPGLRRLRPVDRYKYVSHKLLRWHSATFLTAFLLSSVALAGIALGPLGLLLTAAGAVTAALAVRRARPGLWGRARDVLVALVATNLGVWQALGGRTYQVWQPPPR